MKRITLLFPGQGSQYAGMGKSWDQHFREFGTVLDEASDTIHVDMRELCFEDREDRLWLTQYTQPAILTISHAVLAVLRSRFGIECELTAGHSLGEYSALVALGALRFNDAVRAVHERGLAMSEALAPGAGGMLVYMGTHGFEIAKLCEELSRPGFVLEIANHNSPRQLVLTGHRAALQRADAEIATRELGSTVSLPLSGAFHSTLMEPVAEHLTHYLARLRFAAFSGSLVANIDATLHSSATYTRGHLAQQVARSVLWGRSLKRLHEVSPNALWLEVGPGKTLTKLLRANIGAQDACHSDDVECLSLIERALESRFAA